MEEQAKLGFGVSEAVTSRVCVTASFKESEFGFELVSNFEQALSTVCIMV